MTFPFAKSVFVAAVSAVTLSLSSMAVQAGETMRLAVTDLVGLEQLQREFGAFKTVLEEATGYQVDFFPVSSRTAAVEALRSEKIDFVLTGPAEYVVFAKKSEAKPVVGFSRPDYFSAVIALADSPYTSIESLKGEKVAFGDIGSTSNHLAPMQVVADNGLDPRNDLQPMHVARNVAWKALKRGDVAAVGMNYGKFLGQRAKETELEPGAFRVIGRGPDLPNDVLLVAPHVDAKMIETVKAAFVEKSDALIEAILVGEDNEKYTGMKFLPNIQDSDYDYVRAMYATIGYPEYAEFVGN